MKENCLGIIIPAWNAAKTIHRSLNGILEQMLNGDFDRIIVLVVVNDGSAESLKAAELFRERFEASGFEFRVLTSPKGRRNAIMRAEAQLPPCHRLYLDQDASLSANALKELGKCFTEAAGPNFATFQISFTRSRSVLVRAFMRAWLFSPYVRSSPVTAGVYAVSYEGRKLWTELPDIQADDKFVRLLFKPHQRRLIDSAQYEVLSEPGVLALIKARCRYRRYNAELAERFANRQAYDFPRWSGIVETLKAPRMWIDVVVALSLLLISGVYGGLFEHRRRNS
ncbi:glycosyltransferase family A protein [Roseibium aggregatum]|uniref:Glycosyltransferase n=1 Tax=Roseibium aggregatum TaxID=187304 RepID=A0A939J2S5_9HYPH|nr:glycosyltransferase family 2 protein [Roseibium aggregatum]MBN9673496.1 glycosyltransferase [Roseibium aggregatum]